MKTTSVFMSGGSQAVRLPKEFRVGGSRVGIRREGESIVLDPIRAAAWPRGLWRSIRISDPAFARVPQGDVQRRRSLEGET